MSGEIDTRRQKSYWFVGAAYDDGNEDKTDSFLRNGVWKNGYDKKYSDLVNLMIPGDLIAIKSTYNRKNNLPFDNRDHYVSVMAIKAIGVVTKNHGDGQTIDVEWQGRIDPAKEWYFHTGRKTIWRVEHGDWMADGLIEFTFNGKPQDIDKFRNEPFWQERFGDLSREQGKFEWTKFYEAVSDKLVSFKDKRSDLISFLVPLAEKYKLSYVQNKKLDDICPFTFLGLFNRGITVENRKAIATDVASFLGVNEPVPKSFEGIPILNNQKSWFFGFEDKRSPNDISQLWEIFDLAIRLADRSEQKDREKFIISYDQVASQYNVGWNLTMALYWVRPWSFLTLDSQSQEYITNNLGIEIPKNGAKGRCTGGEYLGVVDDLVVRFKEEAYPVHSFPELSLSAWNAPSLNQDVVSVGWRSSVIEKIKTLCEGRSDGIFTRVEFLEAFLNDLEEEFPNNSTVKSSVNKTFQLLRDDDLLDFLERGQYRWIPMLEENVGDSEIQERSVEPHFPVYSIDSILDDGCFLDRDQLSEFVERLRTKKNVILQGPPGTGKTWLAKRLAFALMGQKNESKLRAVQFHPTLSYEDFVRGWRPSGEGKLVLADGPLLEMVNRAKMDAQSKHVIVIEEINRGNPAQILGEMLTLLEPDKRTPSQSLELCYRRDEGERVFIPDNLYVIGTMNLADRSLALVDLALRRRFAFIDLEPIFGRVWQEWVASKSGVDKGLLSLIENRLTALNLEIEKDASLGSQYRIGHSFVTPAFSTEIVDGKAWFKSVVKTEIGPLLDEYWFDDLDRSSKAQAALI